MIGFAARRLLAAIPLIWGVLTLIFLLVQASPGEPFQALDGPARGPGGADRLREVFGIDRPVATRYVDWLAGFVRVDLGVSLSHRRPVGGLVLEAARRTFLLAGAAMLVQLAVGVATGAVAARVRGGRVDRTISAAAACLYAMPSYWIGLVLVWGLSVRLGWFPASQMHHPDAAALGSLDRLLDLLRHLVLPCLALALPAAAGTALYVRDEVAAVLGRGFVPAARARGCAEARVVLRHALVNALLPIVHLFGLALPGLLGGSVVIEALFAWPGMGRLSYQALLAEDEPLILGCALAASVLVVAGSLAADLIAALLDPRVREATR